MNRQGGEYLSFKARTSLEDAIKTADPSMWEITIPLEVAEELQELEIDFSQLDSLNEEQQEAIKELEEFVADTLAGMDSRHKSYIALNIIADMVSKIPLGYNDN